MMLFRLQKLVEYFIYFATGSGYILRAPGEYVICRLNLTFLDTVWVPKNLQQLELESLLCYTRLPISRIIVTMLIVT